MKLMKRRKPLPIPQKEFGFIPETFNLFQDSTTDGERLAKEREEAEKARLISKKAQIGLFESKPR